MSSDRQEITRPKGPNAIEAGLHGGPETLNLVDSFKESGAARKLFGKTSGEAIPLSFPTTKSLLDTNNSLLDTERKPLKLSGKPDSVLHELAFYDAQSNGAWEPLPRTGKREALPKVDADDSRKNIVPVCDNSAASNALAPLNPVSEAQRLQRHLESRDNGSGGKDITVREEVIDSEGRRTIAPTSSSERLMREVDANYRNALQSTAASEPDRQYELSRIEKKIDGAKKILGLEKTPIIQELEAMQKPEELAKLSPEKRAALTEMRSLLERKQNLENSSLAKISEQYEQYLTDTGQKEALRNFKLYKPVLGTSGFQNWLNTLGDSLPGQVHIGHVSMREEDNPFLLQQKAADALRRGNTAAADRYFHRAIESAEKIDPKTLDAEMKRLKDEKAKLDPNSQEFRSLTTEEEQLKLLKAAPGLMRTAYADYLRNTGHSNEAFQQLNRAASNQTAVDLINGGSDSDARTNGYFAQLVDSTMHGSKEMIAIGRTAATHLQEYDEHIRRAADLSKSGRPEDKQKAEEEYIAARDAASAARTTSAGIDTNSSAENAKLFAEALKAEERKPPEQQDEKRKEMLEQQRQLYDTLSHLPAIASLAQAAAELGIPANGEQAEADKRARISELVQSAEIDHHLASETKAQLDKIAEIVREKSYGEWALEQLRQNSGTLAAIGVSALVGGLTIWSGPGAALAGGAAAGVVAGAVTDYYAGNQVNAQTVAELALAAGGGVISGAVRRRLLATTSKVLSPVVSGAVSGAGAAGAGSAAKHLPKLVVEGPSSFVSEVALSVVMGAVIPRNFILKRVPGLMPVLSHALKDAARHAVGGGSQSNASPINP